MGGGSAWRVESCLSSRAVEVMSTPPLTVAPETPIWDVARRMYEGNAGSALVVGNDGALEGIITRRDILYLVATGAAARNPPAARVMTRSVITARPDEPVGAILSKMTELGLRHIPVIDDRGRPLGMVSLWDIALLLASCLKGEWKPRPTTNRNP